MARTAGKSLKREQYVATQIFGISHSCQLHAAYDLLSTSQLVLCHHVTHSKPKLTQQSAAVAKWLDGHASVWGPISWTDKQ